MQRRFLCSTAWAKERGYDANQIKLFSFSRQNLWAVLLFAGVAFLLVFGQSKLFTHLSGVSELTANLKEDAARTKEPRARLAAQAKNNTLTFGPVIERVVTNMIDFDSGALVDLPLPTPPGERDAARYDWINGEGQGVTWMRSRGIDAIDANHGLIGVDLLLAPMDSREWKSLTPAGLQEKLRALRLPTAPSTAILGDPRDTYGFKTREGGLGIIQITDTRIPRGVKVRYKLVQDNRATAATNSGASALQFRLVAPENSSEPADLLTEPSGQRQFRVLREVLLDGSAIAQAGIDFDLAGRRTIRLRFTEAGARRFEEVTATHINQQLAIVFRGKALSAPIIRTKISGGECVIDGSMRADEMYAIVACLNRAPTPTSQAWTFATPRERVLLCQTPPDELRGWLDLDSGVLVTNQSVDWKTRAGHEWIRTNGLDLVAAVSSRQLPVLTGFDLVVTPAPTNGWESVSATDVVQDWTLMQTEPQTTSTFGVAPGGPDCFLVQTREGGRGILQILGVTADGRAVKVRYKLAQTLTAAKPPGLSSIEEDINAAFDHLNGLQGMKPGQHYELAVGGRKEIGIPDDFLRRRTGSEILASGWSSGCGDYALAFVHLMERRGYQTLLVDSAEISLSSLESHFAGHVVVAVRDTADAGWALVDPTNKRTLSNNWSVNDKTFYGDRYWIGYCGPPADYPVHGPEELKEFYAKTLSRVPRDFWNHHFFRFNFKVDSSLLANDGSCLNPNIPELARNQEQALARFGIRPEIQITILLVKGGNDDKSTLTYSGDRGWVCTLGLQSACSLGLVSYMQERAASTTPR